MQDLRSFRPGRLTHELADFEIIDPAANQGRSCVVLGGASRKYLPRKAAQPLDGVVMKTLVLLHASAWTPPERTEIGSVWVDFTDNTSLRIPVVAGQDVGNWMPPAHYTNAHVGWKESRDDTEVGLYVSCFPVTDKPVARLRFESNGRAVWMIVAAASSPDRLVLDADLQYTFRRNADWREIRFDHAVEPGSALDFSFQLDAPAGKHGFLRAVGENFEFEKRPGVPVRFYGANLTLTANYMSHAEADQLAERLSRIGYNAIRLHHYDRDLVVKTAGNSLEIDPEQLDRLEYLIAALKKRGLYILIDLYSIRDPVAGEFSTLPGVGRGPVGRRDYKLGAMLHPEMNGNLKMFARKLLTHVNPYTGLALIDEPALAGVCVLNENMIFSLYNACRGDREIAAFFRQKFGEFCAANPAEARTASRPAVFRRFLYQVYLEYWRDMATYLRQLGLRAPLTELNHRQAPLALGLRENFDYVDDHIYWDHPRYLNRKRGQPPIRLINTSVLNDSVRILPVRSIAPTRIIGKPFTVTEYNFCYPNAFRAEGLKVGFYYSLLDWHHPDFTIDRLHPLRDLPPEEIAKLNSTRDMKRYAQYMRDQVTELLTNYGKVDIIWFDFSYPDDNGKGRDDWESEKLYELVHRLQPGIIVDNRLDLPGSGDIETPEQFTPDKGMVDEQGNPVVWEGCQTFSGSWGYFRDEMSWKSPRMCIEMLINHVSRGGNLLMNVGPTSSG